MYVYEYIYIYCIYMYILIHVFLHIRIQYNNLYIYGLGCPPAQDASHHQDYCAFSIGDPELNLHLPLLP